MDSTLIPPDQPNPWNAPVLVSQVTATHRFIRNQAFMSWKRRTAAALPLLAERIFALRNKRHEFGQWNLELRLGIVLNTLNDPDNGSILGGGESWRLQMVARLNVDTLFRDVRAAEG
jgi:hypothetical protein